MASGQTAGVVPAGKSYHAPLLTDHGALAQLTLGSRPYSPCDAGQPLGVSSMASGNPRCDMLMT
jgi:hypothetical protein